ADTMTAAIDPKQAKEWFGTNPPDLTLVARSRATHEGSGADYLYTYLRTFYRDDTRATGWNNLAFPNVAMPNPLWELQGQRKATFKKVKKEDGEGVEVFDSWQQISPGTMSTSQYDQAVGDLVSYLQWMSEPSRNTRIRVGVWVLLFLGLFTIIAWRLNAAFWKDVK
ncbi:MAG: cytochrome c1, partial [Rhodoferax sp.]